jgi:ubiquinone biosynthesis protein
MSSLFRGIKILAVMAKYRLQEFLPETRLPFLARLLYKCIPWGLFPRCDSSLSRGVRLRLALEELGPVFIKFGQLLSTRPDVVPPDLAGELSQLQDDVPPFDEQQFISIVEDAFGSDVESIFTEFDQQPLASASVAQVHAAKLKTVDDVEQDVVVKVIRPGIEVVIEQDVSLMEMMARLVQRFFEQGRRLHLIEVVEDYRNTIFDELDLQREAANASQLRRNFENSDVLYVPEVFWDFCRPNVLVMERIYGIPVTDIKQLEEQGTNIQLLAERGVEIFFTQVFRHNFFHADMHPGNIFVSRIDPANPRYIGIDCAIVGSLSREDQYYLARNLLAIFQRDYRLVAELHLECGWVPAHTKVGDFEAAIRTVCEPVFEKPLGEISYAMILVNLFRTAQRFDMEVQPSLVLLQKTLLNIEGLGRQLYPELDLWTTAKPFLEQWMKDRFHPKALFSDLQRYGPDWAEKFPQVPDLIFDAATQIRQLENVLPELERAAHQIATEGRPRAHWTPRQWLGLATLGLGALIAAPFAGIEFSSIPAGSWLLMALGGFWLLRA